MSDAVSTEDGGQIEEVVVETAYGVPVSYSRKQRCIHPNREQWPDLALELLADGWNMCIDVTAVDYLGAAQARSLPTGVDPERFELVVNLISHTKRDRLRVRVQIPESDPTVGSLYAIYPGSDFLEREVYDLMGITFEGHPDLSRIMMPENWEGHPLRKDYAIGSIPVQFKGAPSSR